MLATDLAACAKVFVLQMIFMLMPKPAHTHTQVKRRGKHTSSPTGHTHAYARLAARLPVPTKP